MLRPRNAHPASLPLSLGSRHPVNRAGPSMALSVAGCTAAVDTTGLPGAALMGSVGACLARGLEDWAARRHGRSLSEIHDVLGRAKPQPRRDASLRPRVKRLRRSSHSDSASSFATMSEREHLASTPGRLKWFVPEVHSGAARRLLDTEHQYFAPDLLIPEAGNAIWKKVRRGELTADEAQRLVADLSRWRSTPSHRGLVAEACALANATGRSVYDSMYVALAHLASRIRSSLTYSRRGIPPRCVARRSHIGQYARSSRLAIRAPRQEYSSPNF